MIERDGGCDDDDGGVRVSRNSILMMQLNLSEGDCENTDPNKDFRLASASVHASGALLLESRFQTLLDCNLEVPPSSFVFLSHAPKPHRLQPAPLLSHKYPKAPPEAFLSVPPPPGSPYRQ